MAEKYSVYYPTKDRQFFRILKMTVLIYKLTCLVRQSRNLNLYETILPENLMQLTKSHRLKTPE